MQLYARIKKYLILLTLFFILASGAHLSLLYMYEGAQIIPEKGGVLTIGMIGNIPNLNPSRYLLDSNNDFVLKLLYRGLLRYDGNTRSVEGSLANCNISSYEKISCILRDESMWSNGKKISLEDVRSTYALLAETDINKPLQNLLSKIAISEENGAIVFRAPNASSEILELLEVPIIEKGLAEKIQSGQLKYEDMLFSGPYRFEKHEIDTSHAVEKITLVRNENIESPFGYGRIVFKFFSDREGLIAQANSINVIISNGLITEAPSNLFEENGVLTPNFAAAFANTARLSPELRKSLLSFIKKAPFPYKKGQTSVENPFFSSESLVEDSGSGTLQKTLEKMGYYSKEKLLELLKNQKPNTQPQVTSNTPSDARFFFAPSKKKEFVLAPQDEVLLQGNVPTGTDSVVISGYTLKSFSKGDTTFQYRARTALNNLKIGDNLYAATFKKDGAIIAEETVTLHMIANEAERKAKEASLISPTEAVPNTTPATNLSKEKIESLGNGFYKTDGTAFAINLKSLSVTQDIEDAANFVKKQFESIGIAVNLESVEPSIDALSESKKGDQKNYDLLISGVNLGILGNYLFPHLHSGQAEDGLNFSKLKNPELDILLEDLKSQYLSTKDQERTRSNINNILKKEGVLVPLYAVSSLYFVDKNVKGVKNFNFLPNGSLISSTLEESYINESHIIDGSSKSFSNFILWIKQHFSDSLGFSIPPGKTTL